MCAVSPSPEGNADLLDHRLSDHVAGKIACAADLIPDQPLDENWTMLGSAAGSVVGTLAERFCRAEHEPTRAAPASPALASNR